MFKLQNLCAKHISPVYLLLLLISLNAYANEENTPADVAMLNLTIGQVGVDDNVNDPLRYGIEYRMSSFTKWKIIPAFGFAYAENGASFLYTDLRHDFWISNRWAIIPSFGLGSFSDSEEIKLGNELEFRSGIELAYRFYKQYRLGIAIFHLSNAGISDHNPGTEVVVFSLCIPLGN